MTVSNKSKIGKLVLVDGPDQQAEFDLDSLTTKHRLTFGRNQSCDFVIDHSTVSREHFSIELSGHSVLLVDNRSGNGTFVNGDRITWVALKSGDKIQAGPFVMIAQLADLSEPAEQSTAADPGGQSERPVQADAFSEDHEQTYPRHYLDGIIEFNNGRYYEAHDVWEEVWLHSDGEEKTFYQALIHAAVALYHHSRGNSAGAAALLERAKSRASNVPPDYMSLDLPGLIKQVEQTIQPSEGLTSDGQHPRKPHMRLLPVSYDSGSTAGEL